MYQKSNIRLAKSPKEAATYWLDLYLWTRLEVWYKIDPDAKITMAALNRSPKLKPNNIPATMSPRAMAKPTANIDFRKEKSFWVSSTIAERPVNKDRVMMAAWFKISREPLSVIVMAININGMNMNASATT